MGVLDFLRPESSRSPRPGQRRASKHAADGPEADIARKDPRCAGENAGADANLPALNQQPGRDAGQILRRERPEYDAEQRDDRHGVDSYSIRTPLDARSIVVRLTVAASSRSMQTLTCRAPAQR